MPIEFTQLKHEPEPLRICPFCLPKMERDLRAFRSFMRGQVQSFWRRLLRKPYCCIICEDCKEVVGYERPWEVEHV